MKWHSMRFDEARSSVSHIYRSCWFNAHLHVVVFPHRDLHARHKTGYNQIIGDGASHAAPVLNAARVNIESTENDIACTRNDF